MLIHEKMNVQLLNHQIYLSSQGKAPVVKVQWRPPLVEVVEVKAFKRHGDKNHIYAQFMGIERFIDVHGRTIEGYEEPKGKKGAKRS